MLPAPRNLGAAACRLRGLELRRQGHRARHNSLLAGCAYLGGGASAASFRPLAMEPAGGSHPRSTELPARGALEGNPSRAGASRTAADMGTGDRLGLSRGRGRSRDPLDVLVSTRSRARGGSSPLRVIRLAEISQEALGLPARDSVRRRGGTRPLETLGRRPCRWRGGRSPAGGDAAPARDFSARLRRHSGGK